MSAAARSATRVMGTEASEAPSHSMGRLRVYTASYRAVRPIFLACFPAMRLQKSARPTYAAAQPVARLAFKSLICPVC